MLKIKLPDGSIKEFAGPLTVYDVAQSIGSGLAKAALAGRMNGQLIDRDSLITSDCALKIITSKEKEGLEIIRHSTAHLMAHAVKRLFPEAQITIGPVIDDGFYYDFAFRPFTPEDLPLIEAKMQELADADYSIERRELSKTEASEYFQSIGETYKAQIIADLPGETVSLYKQAEFEDLCRGPHVPSTGWLKAFKLTKIAGAYWRGKSSNEMLQRIYGTSWTSKKDLVNHLERLEEAEKRDHRKLGKSLDLFHFQDIAPGMVFWHPKGWTIYQLLEQYIRGRLMEFGYQEIRTPQLVDTVLWASSGHLENFRDEMFLTETENRQYAIKPMSCPCHVQIYKQGGRSYRELPLRYSEFGNCHRCEPSGALHGLMRVRNMVQDDGHIFCTEEQIQSEVGKILDLVMAVYTDFGFNQINYRLALRPDKRVGHDTAWDKAEEALKQALQSRNIDWVDAPGEGAFYGPKIECSLADCLGRIWQCGTIQIDFSMPERLEASYIDKDNNKRIPVMIHRAILGSFERFIGILIEHYAGRFPLWLAPTQAVVLPITEKQYIFAEKITSFLQNQGIRANFDLRNETISLKIREHSLQKIPYIFILGDKEINLEAKQVEDHSVTVRTLEGKDLGMMNIKSVCDKLRLEIQGKMSAVRINQLED